MTWWKLKNRWLQRHEPKDGNVTISAVVHRRDGSIEDLGVVSRGKSEMKPEVR